tara:strand:+ start:464 stop:1159 length:696 start_codon:yes stop_codon:yes gene_type:complete
MASAKQPTGKQVWDTLSKINVNEQTEKKMGLTYLSWAWAYGIFMEHFPEMEVKWHGAEDASGVLRDVMYYEGGTASVTCSVIIGDLEKKMWLPVTDNRNKAIAHPDAMAINTAKMRCLTKCFAIWGLGHYIYRGEDVPITIVEEASAPKKPKPKKAPQKQKEESTVDHIAELRTVATDLHERGWTPEGDTKKEIKAVIASGDQEKAAVLTKRLKDAGELALKINDEKEEKE